MVVVLPAPFAPSKPTISPFETRNDASSTAVTDPRRRLGKIFDRWSTSTIKAPTYTSSISS
jgi:hypothetical protein